jgi:hypothetical protein
MNIEQINMNNSLFDLDGMALYKFQRWQQSQSDNERFFFGGVSLSKSTHDARRK